MAALRKPLGIVVALAGAATVFHMAWPVHAALVELVAQPLLFGAVLCGAAGYSTARWMLALGWVGLARSGRAKPPRGELVRIFAASAVARYLPGNLFHFGGRPLLAGRLGVRRQRVDAAGRDEFVITFAAAVLVACAALVASREPALGAGMIGIVLLGGVLGRHRPALAMAGLACLFFTLNALLITALASLLENSESRWLPLTATYLLSWAASALVPGVPAGVGVREALFVWLSNVLLLTVTPVALTLALSMRIVSLVGDALFFGIGATAGTNAITRSELS